MTGRPELEIVSSGGAGPSPEEAAAVVAALEQFLRNHALVVAPEAPRRSAWASAALREGVNRAPDSPPFWA